MPLKNVQEVAEIQIIPEEIKFPARKKEEEEKYNYYDQ